jgi:two-component system sensor histidine kinase KdpD
VLAMLPPEDHAFDSPEALHQLETFANQTALAIERASSRKRRRAPSCARRRSGWRNSLLSSVSHDLRTPLATIIGASSGLLEGGDRLSATTRRDLIRSIHGEASHLDRLVNGFSR